MIMHYNTQTKKQLTWADEKGGHVPVKNLKKSELAVEKVTGIIAKDAVKLNALLRSFKSKVKELVQEAIAAIMADYSGEKTVFKGNYTVYNFDRSIKVMVKVARPVRFDEMIIALAKNKINEFLKEGISAKNEFTKEMAMSAFETRNGQLDVNKVLSLRRWRDRVNDPVFLEALDLIDNAIRYPETSTYYQVWLRDSEGRYETVKLDFSRI